MEEQLWIDLTLLIFWVGGLRPLCLVKNQILHRTAWLDLHGEYTKSRTISRDISSNVMIITHKLLCAEHLGKKDEMISLNNQK